ncbi:MAG: PKD domain-containing protein, partial [Bacteroidota bacterium]
DVSTEDIDLVLNAERRKRERFIAFLLILIGIIGLYLLSKPDSPNRTLIQGPIYKHEASLSGSTNSSKKSNSFPSNPAQQIKQQSTIEQLQVHGHMEAQEDLLFTVDSYDAHATYTLHLGNGKVKRFHGQSLRYAYPQSGSYQVRLNVSFEGETKELANRTLEIMEAIAVAPNATIDF